MSKEPSTWTAATLAAIAVWLAQQPEWGAFGLTSNEWAVVCVGGAVLATVGAAILADVFRKGK